MLILKVLDPETKFVVITNAYSEGLGGVLMQDAQMISYESLKLKPYEKNYASHDLELLVVVHTLKMWRHYLLGKTFELKIDHDELKYLFAQPKLNARKRR